MDLEDYGFLPEPNDPRLYVPHRGAERSGPNAHQLCGSVTKDFAMSIPYVADPGHEDTIGRLGLGTKLLHLFGCSLGGRCTSRGVSDGHATRSAATKWCTGPTNPAASQHVGVGRVPDCDDPNGNRHQALASLTPLADARSLHAPAQAAGSPKAASPTPYICWRT